MDAKAEPPWIPARERVFGVPDSGASLGRMDNRISHGSLARGGTKLSLRRDAGGGQLLAAHFRGGWGEAKLMCTVIHGWQKQKSRICSDKSVDSLLHQLIFLNLSSILSVSCFSRDASPFALTGKKCTEIMRAQGSGSLLGQGYNSYVGITEDQELR